MNILITGGTSGLGKACVELLQKDGHTIYFSYLPTGEDCSIAHELCGHHSNILGEPVDFTSNESISQFCAKIPSWNIDVLVNCTYVGQPQTTYFHKIPVTDFLSSFQNNIIPTIRITQTCIETMKKKRMGKIINIITEAILGLPPMGYSIYAANKAYLMELSSVWNKEYTRYNITSNCILPAYMGTPFAKVDDRIVEQMVQEHPLKKLLTPEEVAFGVKFFIDASQQVNGVKLTINAGTKI